MRWRIAFVIGLLLCGWFQVELFFPQGLFVTPGVTPENFDRIQIGMSQRDIESILGPPDSQQMYVTGGYMQFWSGPEYVVVLSFCPFGVCSGDLQKDCVILKELPPQLPSHWMYLRHALGL
jgi:hypothetical protein